MESLVIARRAPSEIAQSRMSRASFHLMVTFSRCSARVLVCLCREAGAGVTSNTFFYGDVECPNQRWKTHRVVGTRSPMFRWDSVGNQHHIANPFDKCRRSAPGSTRYWGCIIPCSNGQIDGRRKLQIGCRVVGMGWLWVGVCRFCNRCTPSLKEPA